jgi:hypothetical protein
MTTGFAAAVKMRTTPAITVEKRIAIQNPPNQYDDNYPTRYLLLSKRKMIRWVEEREPYCTLKFVGFIAARILAVLPYTGCTLMIAVMLLVFGQLKTTIRSFQVRAWLLVQ